jgi:hypothetical protein
MNEYIVAWIVLVSDKNNLIMARLLLNESFVVTNIVILSRLLAVMACLFNSVGTIVPLVKKAKLTMKMNRIVDAINFTFELRHVVQWILSFLFCNRILSVILETLCKDVVAEFFAHLSYLQFLFTIDIGHDFFVLVRFLREVVPNWFDQDVILPWLDDIILKLGDVRSNEITQPIILIIIDVRTIFSNHK